MAESCLSLNAVLDASVRATSVDTNIDTVGVRPMGTIISTFDDYFYM